MMAIPAIATGDPATSHAVGLTPSTGQSHSAAVKI
jgi:hypothetical protein